MKHLPPIGSIHEVTTTSMGHGPEAIARLTDGAVVFVSRAAPNERVTVEITEHHGSYARGVVRDVLVASPDRREAPCRHARSGECGGCPWQHLGDDAQAREKEAFVRREAARAAPEARVNPIGRPVPPFGYRRRARFGYRGSTGPGPAMIGYRAGATRTLFNIEECPILDARLETALPSFRSKIPRGGSGNVDAMVEPDGRLRFGLDASPFAQPSAQAESALVLCALDALPAAPGAIAELFAGAGTFTVPLLERGYQVTAYEGDPATVRRLRDNAPAARAVRMNLLAEGLQLDLGPVDAVLLDPPRAGAFEAMAAIAESQAPVVIYVSCAPMTLFRDLKRLRELGYDVEWIQPFDAFPQTFHVETVTRCVRR